MAWDVHGMLPTINGAHGTRKWWATLCFCPPYLAGKAAKGLKCTGNSLVAGTLVHTEEGLVPIELVKVGDRVLSWDERTGETSYRPVMELIQHEGTYELVKVTLESGEQLEATSGHPFYIQGKGWNAAAGLKVGDALLLYNGMTVVVETVDSSTRFERVYNFSVAGNANYFVGSGGVGVHNCVIEVRVSRKDHPEAAEHIEEAIASGKPDILTVDRHNTKERRKQSLRNVEPKPGSDRDEYPSAMFQEGGEGASVKYIDPSDNRGAGACIGGQCRKLPNGTKVKIIVVD